ncbi:unnamed protein product [Rhodiola kirilowii]
MLRHLLSCIRSGEKRVWNICLSSLAGFANGLIWVAYALIQFDLNLTIANGMEQYWVPFNYCSGFTLV